MKVVGDDVHYFSVESVEVGMALKINNPTSIEAINITLIMHVQFTWILKKTRHRPLGLNIIQLNLLTSFHDYQLCLFT